MKRYMLFLVFATLSITVFGQKERKFIRKGNDLYRQGVENSDSTAIDSLSFANAEVEYRKALDKKPNDLKAQFNIGNAQFKQQKMAEAATQFEQTLELAENKEDKARTYFNYGNAMLAQQKLDESIEAYKNALRNNPSDLEAKYNLEFARRMKQQQEQQQQNQDQNQDQNKDQNQDQQDQNKDQQDQNQDQNKDQQDQNQDQNKDQQNQQQQQNEQQPKISKQSAEQMLKALQNDEKETQEKVKKAEAAKAKTNQPEIDW